MWAVRRATINNPLRELGYQILARRTFPINGHAFSNGILQSLHQRNHDRWVVADNPLPKRDFVHVVYTKFFVGGRCLSSQARPEASGDEESPGDGFSELESLEIVEGTKIMAKEEADDLISGSETSKEDDSGDDLTRENAEIGITERTVDLSVEVKEFPEKTCSPLTEIIMKTSVRSVKGAIDKWVEGGNIVTQDVVSTVMRNLRTSKFFKEALQFSEWLEAMEASGNITFTEQDYASRIDLVAKVHSIHDAELYLKSIPATMHTELVFRTLLANCVSKNMMKKSEQLFYKMKNKGLPLTAFSCCQLLLLYKRHNRKKLDDVLLMMKRENVKPNLTTYKILIDAKGRDGDYKGMEQVIENMKSEGIDPDCYTHSLVASYYIEGRSNQKAEAALKEMEKDLSEGKRAACPGLLRLYAALGKVDDVSRIWKLCEPNPQLAESFAAIEAWGKLGKIETAEAVFEKIEPGMLTQRIYAILLNVYASHKLLDKGKDLLKRMWEEGRGISPVTLDSIVNLYVRSGEVEKADSVLHRAMQTCPVSPFYVTYMAILKKYADRGDIHNAEKIFEKLRWSGYIGKVGMYQELLRAYINARSPAYGFAERLKADKVLPQKTLALQLAQVGRFNRSEMAQFLE